MDSGYLFTKQREADLQVQPVVLVGRLGNDSVVGCDRDCFAERDDWVGNADLPAPPMKSSWRSFRQISRCSSPAPAIMCSPVSSMVH